jgi:uncharacterized membrane protein
VCAVGLYAVAPLAIQYAQDARPYALPSLVLVLSLLALERLRRSDRLSSWLLYGLCIVLAAHSHYVLLPIIGAQLLALLILLDHRWHVIVGGAATCIVIGASLAVFSAGAASELDSWRAVHRPLAMVRTLQVMLGGDDNANKWIVRALMLSPAVVACAAALADRRSWPAQLPHALQIASLLVASFVLLPIAGVFVPWFEARQFQILLPSVFVCLSLGLRQLSATRFGKITVATVLVAMFASSAIADWSYFQKYRKSSEAEAVQAVVSRAQSGDVAVMDCPSFSSSLALAYYAPMMPYYRCVGEEDGTIRLSAHGPARDRDDRLSDNMLVHTVDLQQVASHRRIWVFSSPDGPAAVVTALPPRYQLRDEFRQGATRVTLLEQHEPTLESRPPW